MTVQGLLGPVKSERPTPTTFRQPDCGRPKSVRGRFRRGASVAFWGVSEDYSGRMNPSCPSSGLNWGGRKGGETAMLAPRSRVHVVEAVLGFSLRRANRGGLRSTSTDPL